MNTNTYGFKVLYAFDVFVSSLIWRDVAITISAHAGKALRLQDPPLWAKVVRYVCWPFGGWNHCENAIAADIQKCNNSLKILLQ